MSDDTRTRLKVGGLVVGLVGLLAGLANVLGLFSHPAREQMVALIRSHGEIPATTPGFSDLLSAYPPAAGVQISQIAGIGPTSLMASGGYVTPVGPLAYFDASPQRRSTAPVLTFDELQSWAKSSGYPWVGWLISAIGWVVLAVGITGDLLKPRVS